MKNIIIATSTLVLIGISAPASAGPMNVFVDHLEDGLDRLENRIDERVDNGPRDRFEDKVDRWEDRRDRNGKWTPKFLDRHERRSWKRH